MKQLHDLPIQFKREGSFESPDGVFNIPHYRIKGYVFKIIFSSNMGWEHLSVTLTTIVTQQSKKILKPVDRCATWEEMCFLKDLFWEVTECVVQFHPPMAEHISNHPYCLHLWRSTEKEFPAPDSIMVGIKGEFLDEILSAIKEVAPGYTYIQYMTAISTTRVADFKEDRTKYLEQVEACLLTLKL